MNSIYKKQDNHILINYVYNYGKEYLLYYSNRILFEMEQRNVRVKSFENFFNYFGDILYFRTMLTYRFAEHNDEYLLCNYYNLLEKYRRGQKDFSEEEFERLTGFIKKSLDKNVNKREVLI